MTNISTLESEPVSQSRAFFSETEPVVIENQINNAVAFQEQEDDEEVRDTFFNRPFRRKRGMVSNPLFIIPDFSAFSQ